MANPGDKTVFIPRSIRSVIPGLTRESSTHHHGCRIKSGMTSVKNLAYAGTQSLSHFVIPGLTQEPSAQHHRCRIKFGMTSVF
jgi:hypothetical protein